MQIRSSTLTRTIQLRHYEPLQLSLTAEIGDGQSAGVVSMELLEEARAVFWEATGHQRAEFSPRSLVPLPFDDA